MGWASPPNHGMGQSNKPWDGPILITMGWSNPHNNGMVLSLRKPHRCRPWADRFIHGAIDSCASVTPQQLRYSSSSRQRDFLFAPHLPVFSLIFSLPPIFPVFSLPPIFQAFPARLLCGTVPPSPLSAPIQPGRARKSRAGFVLFPVPRARMSHF